MAQDKKTIKEDFGVINYERLEDVETVESLEAYSQNGPQFINDADGDLWEQKWTDFSENRGIKYVHGQNRFYKNSKSCWSKEEIKKNIFAIRNLLKNYNASSLAYDEVVAKPFIEKRRKILEGIILNPTK